MSDVEFSTVCQCGGYSRDHDVVYRYYPDDNHPDFTVTTGLNHYLPWYKRVVIAIKYALGIDNTHHFYTEQTLSVEEVTKLRNFLNETLETYK